MSDKIKNYLGITIIGAIILLLVISFWYVNSYSKTVAPQRTFTVNGEGKVVVIPDVAEFSFGVLTEGGKDIATLQKENSTKINKIISFLKESGVVEKDIKTQYYNISPRYQYFSCPAFQNGKTIICPPSEIVGYSINQSVLVKIRDLNKAGEIVAGVVSRGANNVLGPNFTVDDFTQYQNQAREEAVNKAKTKAEAIAKAAGFSLGRLISIQEGVNLPPLMRSYNFEQFGKGGGDASPFIEAGSQEITVSVTLSYEIK